MDQIEGVGYVGTLVKSNIFPIGSTVTLTNDDDKNAKVGSTAKVLGFTDYNDKLCVIVKWLTFSGFNYSTTYGQNNGEYYPEHFSLEMSGKEAAALYASGIDLECTFGSFWNKFYGDATLFRNPEIKWREYIKPKVKQWKWVLLHNSGVMTVSNHHAASPEDLIKKISARSPMHTIKEVVQKIDSTEIEV